MYSGSERLHLLHHVEGSLDNQRLLGCELAQSSLNQLASPEKYRDTVKMQKKRNTPQNVSLINNTTLKGSRNRITP